MSKYAQAKWEWNAETGETMLTNVSPDASVVIVKYSGNRHYFEIGIGEYWADEWLKPTPYQHQAEKQATARLKHHLAQYMKQERKRCASVQAQCKDILKRLRA